MRVKSGYSFRTTYGHIDNVFTAVEALEWPAMPLADRNSTFGFAAWDKLCRAAGKKPIFGVELGVSPNPQATKAIKSFWTFYAKDDISKINDLVALATKNTSKLLTYDQALQADGVIKIMDNFVQLNQVFAQDDLYLALSPATPKGLVQEAKANNHKLIASSEMFYPYKDDKELYHVLLGNAARRNSYPKHLVNDDEWRIATRFNATPLFQKEAIDNLIDCFTKCNATLRRGELFHPAREKTLAEMCDDGAVKLGIYLSPDYVARLVYELKIIKEKDFEDYFYIVADMMNFARQNMLVGPGRGSSAGSLVCYLLGITSVDPIKHNLLFERFIDPSRSDYPDIDSDFPDDKRHLVFDYMETKYGRDHVARMGSVTLFRDKSLINQAGKALKIPTWIINKTNDASDKFEGTPKDILTSSDTGIKLLHEYPEIETIFPAYNHPNNAGVHAAGLILTNDKISKYVAVDSSNKSAMLDKYMAEQQNLLKIDMLGLVQLKVFQRCLDLIGHKGGANKFFSELSLNDPKVFDVFNSGKFAGLFQFQAFATKALTKKIKVEKFEDLTALNALSRPGASAGANRYVDRKNHPEKLLTYDHPCLEPFLKETLGSVVYQEQLFSIVKEIGGFSVADSNAFRRAVSRSSGVEVIEKFRAQFVEGAARFGFVAPDVDQFFSGMLQVGNYAFNRSHSVSYSIIAYWSAFLKAYHPIEFAAASLDSENDPEKQIKLLKDLEADGVEYVAIDVDHSTDKWEVKDGKLIGPLTNIKGIGSAAVKTILESRATGKKLPMGIWAKLSEAETALDTLNPLRDFLAATDLEAMNIVSKPTPLFDIEEGDPGILLVFGIIRRVILKDRNDKVSVERRNGRRLDGNQIAYNIILTDDDANELLCIVAPEDLNKWKETVEKLVEGKSVVAIKGSVPRAFRMLSVMQLRILGELK